jgi:hypothetical protein
MEPINFEESDVIYGENQPEYMPLPAKFGDRKLGEIHTCWKLSPEEISEIQKTGVIWLSILTFRNPLQPVALSATKPFENK